ncbi:MULTISPECIES: flagellar hook-associated protein FlgK [Serratia]|jgi:flagellar hook-associated protein 1 FlgK|uniref:Flagellar hook-associated protein 1 n=1 Tax=Serratia surfactantfaciens TaxID=2741499 RepID=A0ABS0M274_9GAMM|nr:MULTISPECIES: flagellar hook-associated protein FlgK [Serratia]OKP52101.1 flagellar hook-associated protein FlgK [Serratia marcescens]AOE99823.1 flagellar hook-associated protein FlgK [Serratia surfactantfaciens]MBH1920910.1 flagellar hook-associated protein FlgK [Serratia surfactantfaciens]MBI6153292.1 flagellar hook-associated protein FlgK [Serratia surfactantfaciens]MTD05925.1 flagellar hook-associated protein FlgK [Serratia sp. YC16]
MSNSLINTAMSGLNAAQVALSTVSNNISNYNVAGYNRQTAILAQNGGMATMSGFIGNGVTVTSVNREYNQFITNQLRSSQSAFGAQNAYYEKISQIDNLLASKTNPLSANMQDFFTNLQNLVSNAGDDAARQTVLGKANGLVNQFNNTDKFLRDMDSGVNQQISDTAQQINSYSQQIAKLNDEITRLRGSAAGEPNALLDQRDQLVTELNQLVGVQVTQQDGDAYTVSFANGLTLVQGSNTYQVEAMPSSSDPSRLTIGYNRGNGASEVPEGQITSGSLSGVLKFRSETLDGVRNQLGQLALAMADSFNQQHRAGFDLNGDAGGDFFSFSGGRVVDNTRNTGDASLSVAYTDTGKVKANDYRVEFDGSNWQVSRLPDNVKVNATPGTSADGKPTLNFDGLEVSIDGNAKAKDSFTVKPVSDVAGNLKVAITDSSKIAAAGKDDSGRGDNENAKKLLDLQTKNLVDGKATLSGAYAGIVSGVGNQTAAAKAIATSQAKIVKQLGEQQQSLSGVNLDEEYGELLRFQQYYMANAQVIQTASSLFDALLNIR